MRCVILDSSAIFHLRDLSAILSLGDKFYVTELVLEELRDPRAQAVIELLRPEIIQVDYKRLRELMEKEPALSRADCSIILCAEQLLREGRCKEIIVVTDDLTLRKHLRKMSVKVQTVYFGRARR